MYLKGQKKRLWRFFTMRNTRITITRKLTDCVMTSVRVHLWVMLRLQMHLKEQRRKLRPLWRQFIIRRNRKATVHLDIVKREILVQWIIWNQETRIFFREGREGTKSY